MRRGNWSVVEQYWTVLLFFPALKLFCLLWLEQQAAASVKIIDDGWWINNKPNNGGEKSGNSLFINLAARHRAVTALMISASAVARKSLTALGIDEKKKKRQTKSFNQVGADILSVQFAAICNTRNKATREGQAGFNFQWQLKSSTGKKTKMALQHLVLQLIAISSPFLLGEPEPFFLSLENFSISMLSIHRGYRITANFRTPSLGKREYLINHSVSSFCKHVSTMSETSQC